MIRTPKSVPVAAVASVVRAAKRWRKEHDMQVDMYSLHPGTYIFRVSDADLMRAVDKLVRAGKRKVKR